MPQWIKCTTPGVRYRLHPTRKHGIGYDRYYTIRYRVAGKEKSEGLGWASDGWSERKVAAILSELKTNYVKGEGPLTLSEKRELQRQARLEEKKKEEREKRKLEMEEKTKFSSVYSQYCEIHSDKKSLKNERILCEKWILPSIGHKKIDEIVLLDLERIRKKMEKCGKAPRTIQYIKSIIRQTYNFAISHNLYVGGVPTKDFLKNKKFDNARNRYLTVEEARTLLAELQKHSLTVYRMALLSLNTGMRYGEIALLRWQHIDIEGRKLIVLDPKNKESRMVFLTVEVVKMFESMEKGSPDAIVFPARYSRKINSSQPPTIQKSISNVFDRTVCHLGLNKGITDRRMRVVFHSLRHTAASWLVNSGVSLPVIGKILGHKSLKMTERYAHVGDSSVKNAMEVLNKKQKSHKNQSVPRVH